jgi:hypothetical protein
LERVTDQVRDLMVDEANESFGMPGVEGDAEIKEIMGLFDAPAFARRGVELAETLGRLHERCRRARADRLDMVHLRLRQWSRVVVGPDAWAPVFSATIGPLWQLSGAEPPEWARSPAPLRRQREIARELIAAVVRFNERWSAFLDRLNVDPANDLIGAYNRNYVFEKECVMGSRRLAARFFTPAPLISRERLLLDHPLLPVPAVCDRRSRAE